MVILIFDKSSLLSKNKFIGKQKYFFAYLFFKRCPHHDGNGVFLLLSIIVLLLMATFFKKNVSVLKNSSRTH